MMAQPPVLVQRRRQSFFIFPTVNFPNGRLHQFPYPLGLLDKVLNTEISDWTKQKIKYQILVDSAGGGTRISGPRAPYLKAAVLSAGISGLPGREKRAFRHPPYTENQPGGHLAPSPDLRTFASPVAHGASPLSGEFGTASQPTSA